MAAGLSIREESLNEFRAAFEVVAQELIDKEMLVKTIVTDGTLNADEFTLRIAKDLQQQVWGQGFPEPLFEGEFRILSQRIVGEKHLKLKLNAGSSDLNAIYFFSTDELPDKVHAVFSLSINEYNGKESLQLIVRQCT